MMLLESGDDPSQPFRFPWLQAFLHMCQGALGHSCVLPGHLLWLFSVSLTLGGRRMISRSPFHWAVRYQCFTGSTDT